MLQAVFSSQNGDCAWGVYYRRAAFWCTFSWGDKRTQCKRYVSCLRWDMFVAWAGSQLGVKRFADDEEVETEVWKWLRQRSKDCGFQCTGKAMGQVYQRWWRICREINAFSQVRTSHVLRFMSICELFTDSPSYVCRRMQGWARIWGPIHRGPTVALYALRLSLQISGQKARKAP
jgi:hypothetical protein